MVNQKTKYRKPVQGNKEERTGKAQEWLKTLNAKWKNEVDKAVDCSVYHSMREASVIDDFLSKPLTPEYPETVTRIFSNDVVTCAKAAVTHADKDTRVCVLNFASYTNPGGGFLKGATAQEEALCFATGLYPCLQRFQSKYDAHRKEETDGCYSHDYIYSKDVPFIVNGKCYFVDVITMAAPNQKASKFSPVEDIFAERMEIAFRAPEMHGADILLLGAWGCGAFGNDPEFVASTWKTLTSKYDGVYKEVVHPVLDARMCKTFKEIIYEQKRTTNNTKKAGKR